ncbi:citramalate synthase [Amycolatopsis sp. La24]|uniref:citramalate synthase n=1 Tax=Amycolatopsis sp. La24 TaxID=3028304 RepID=UPI0023B1FFE4|nr:citramalate synthase [Amycolatopsis sp. La24]
MNRTSPAETPLGDAFHLYDTTLRDGAQSEGISYSVEDKLAVARLLDGLGVGFIEGGWPGAMPKDTEFFRRAAEGELRLRHAALVAFGSTRKPGRSADQDPQVRGLLASGAQVVTLVAKADRRHIERALRTDVAENLAMIADTVRFLTAEGRRVFLDAEHFFDGYHRDPDTALRVLESAMEAGADVAILCDTNGGQLPARLAETVHEVAERTGFRVGVHCHDDTGCAVANSVAAVQAGATHVQVTANGYGERTGNANLFTVAGNLTTKLDLPVLPPSGLSQLTRASSAIAKIAEVAEDPRRPYVGASAFAHKAGLHASAIKVDPGLYHHLDPAAVGNRARILITELAGRASLELKAAEFGLAVAPAILDKAMRRVKALEASGWSFEAADASLELLLHDELGDQAEPIEPVSCRLLPDVRAGSAATAQIRVGDAVMSATTDGASPVEAVQTAVRQAVLPHLPWLAEVHFIECEVRTLIAGGSPVTRVRIVSGDRTGRWSTVGAHATLAQACAIAACDALAYHHLRLRNNEVALLAPEPM